MINITEMIINQFEYGTMDKEELRKKVDVMYMCSAFSTEDYKKIIAIYEEVTKKEETKKENTEVTTQ